MTAVSARTLAARAGGDRRWLAQLPGAQRGGDRSGFGGDVAPAGRV
jgi:hypothetical protein